MPSIEQNRAAGQKAIETGAIVPVTPVNSPANSPTLPLATYPQTPNPYQRTPLPAISTQQPDQQRQFQSGSVPQDRLIGVPLNANPVISAQTITNIVRVPSTIAGGILLETNNQPNAIQNVLNLIPGSNVTVVSDAHGGVTIASTASSASTPSLPIPNTAVYYMARAIVGQTGLQTIGDASTSAQNGGATTINNGVVPTSTLGVVVPLTLGNGAIAGYNGWFPVNSSIFWAGRNCKYQARFTTQLSCISFFGFTTGTPSTMRTIPFAAIDYVGLATPNIGPGDHWQAFVNANQVDTGVPITTGLTYVEIDINDTANTTTFIINGGTPTVISGFNPSGFGWFPTATFSIAGPGPLNFNIEYFYASQDF